VEDRGRGFGRNLQRGADLPLDISAEWSSERLISSVEDPWLGEGRPTMRFNPHPNKEGTERDKPLWPASPFLSAYFSPAPLLPITPWPPSLVPTWKTTAWIGICFSRLTASGTIPACRVSSRAIPVVPVSRFREVTPVGARARAPPPSVWPLQRNGESTALIYSDAPWGRESQTTICRRGDARKPRLSLYPHRGSRFRKQQEFALRSYVFPRPCAPQQGRVTLSE